MRDISLRRRGALVSCDGRRFVRERSVGAELNVCLPVVEPGVAVRADTRGFRAGERGVDKSGGNRKVDEEDHVRCGLVCGGVADGGEGCGH